MPARQQHMGARAAARTTTRTHAGFVAHAAPGPAGAAPASHAAGCQGVAVLRGHAAPQGPRVLYPRSVTLPSRGSMVGTRSSHAIAPRAPADPPPNSSVCSDGRGWCLVNAKGMPSALGQPGSTSGAVRGCSWPRLDRRPRRFKDRCGRYRPAREGIYDKDPSELQRKTACYKRGYRAVIDSKKSATPPRTSHSHEQNATTTLRVPLCKEEKKKKKNGRKWGTTRSTIGPLSRIFEAAPGLVQFSN